MGSFRIFLWNSNILFVQCNMVVGRKKIIIWQCPLDVDLMESLFGTQMRSPRLYRDKNAMNHGNRSWELKSVWWQKKNQREQNTTNPRRRCQPFDLTHRWGLVFSFMLRCADFFIVSYAELLLIKLTKNNFVCPNHAVYLHIFSKNSTVNFSTKMVCHRPFPFLCAKRIYPFT